MEGNQPTITDIWGLGQHGETAHFQINYAIKTVLFFSTAFWATEKRQSRSSPVELWLLETGGKREWDKPWHWVLPTTGVLSFLGMWLWLLC